MVVQHHSATKIAPMPELKRTAVGRKRLAYSRVWSCSRTKALEADKHYMRLALEEASQAYASGEVPVGAVLVHRDQVVCTARNRMETSRDPTQHAEMQVIQQAAMMLGRHSLPETTLYVSLEPCPMCAGALLQCRVGTVVYGAKSLLGADGSWISLLRAGHIAGNENNQPAATASRHPFHPDIQVRQGVLAEESAALMKKFFRERRSSQLRRDLVWDSLADTSEQVQ